MQKFNRHWVVSYGWTLFLLAIFIPHPSVKADFGPKPSMDFYFQYQEDTIVAIEGKLLVCTDKNCAINEEFEGNFNCTPNSCAARTYRPWHEFGEYHKIIITFNDGIRESNVFTKEGLDAQYEVKVEKDHLLVKEKINLGTFSNSGFLVIFLASACLTIPVEIIVALIYLWIIKGKKSFLVWVILVNIFSLPIVWFVLPLIWVTLANIFSLPLIQTISFYIIAETFAIVFEAILLALAGYRLKIPMKHVILLSLVMNLASFTIGWLFIV
jgi:hypothetical protein